MKKKEGRWAMRKKLLVCFLLLALTVSACLGYRVAEGTLRDTIFSVEQTRNGNWRVFMTHDDVAGYCTNNQELGEKAYDLLMEHDGEVILKFRSIKADDEAYSWWSASDCGTVTTGDSSMAMFLMEDIYSVRSR